MLASSAVQGGDSASRKHGFQLHPNEKTSSFIVRRGGSEEDGVRATVRSEGKLATAALPCALAATAPLGRKAAPGGDDDGAPEPCPRLPPVDGDEKLTESCATEAEGPTTYESELPAPAMPDGCELASPDDGGGDENVARISESRVAHSE